MKHKYFKQTVRSLINDLNSKYELPRDFYQFLIENNYDTYIYNLKPSNVKGIGLGIYLNNKIYLFGTFLDEDELINEIMFNAENSIVNSSILKFANNEFPEGGFYISLNKSTFGNVYFYKNYYDWAGPDDIICLSETFSNFLDSLFPVGINFSNEGTELIKLDEKLDENDLVTELFHRA